MDGSLESSIKDAVSAIHPVRTVLLRKTQLIQSGVTVDDGPTLEDIRAEEESDNSTSAQEEIQDETQEGDEIQEIEVEASEDSDVPEVESEEKGNEDVPDYASMKVAELKELLKAAGKPVSGKKADLIARLME
jgi:2-methylaconitate cis-trans-isomerase PrpF